MPEIALPFIDNFQTLTAQGMGFVSLLFYVLAGQMKSSKMMIRVSGLGALAFSIHFLLLAAIVPCIIKLIACIRSFCMSTEFGRRYRHWIIPTCLTVAVVAGICSADSWWMLICLGGPVAWCAAEFIGEETKMRPLGIVSESFWLTNNVLVFSLGGIVASAMIITSFGLAMWRQGGFKNRFIAQPA